MMIETLELSPLTHKDALFWAINQEEEEEEEEPYEDEDYEDEDDEDEDDAGTEDAPESGSGEEY